jgi:hypothetical protein
MKTPTVIFFSAALLLFAAAAANAEARQPEQKSPSSAEATFKSLDRNRDQALSKIEAKADESISAAFAMADVNLDGYVSKAEYMAHVQRSTAPTPAPEPRSH